MVLKESYAYQNALTKLMQNAALYLATESNTTNKTQTHNKQKVVSTMEDETIEVNKKNINSDFIVDNNVMIDYYVALMNEKIALSRAIGLAKSTANVNVDITKENNKTLQEVVAILKRLATIRSFEKEFETTGYTFNQEGNQTPFHYTVKEVTTIDFDRNKVKSLSKSLLAQSDENSSAIDIVESTTEVDFTPKFDIHDSFEESYLTFAATIVENK